MKNMARITAVLILALICAGVWGQDADDTIFVQNIIRAAERLRWDALETGALERNLLMYRWEHLTGVDPEVMALALSYGKDQGIENPAQQARVAHQLAESIQEMAGAGLSSRESARAVLQGMRDAGPGAPDFEGRLREHVRMQLEDAEGQTLRRRAEKRAGRAGSGDTWNPPAPKGRPGGGREDIPAGPGDGPGPGGPSGQQKGR